VRRYFDPRKVRGKGKSVIPGIYNPGNPFRSRGHAYLFHILTTTRGFSKIQRSILLILIICEIVRIILIRFFLNKIHHGGIWALLNLCEEIKSHLGYSHCQIIRTVPTKSLETTCHFPTTFNNGTLISTTVRLFQQRYAYFNNGTLITTTLRPFQQWYAYCNTFSPFRLFQQRYAHYNNGTLISTMVRSLQQRYAYFNNGTPISTMVRLLQYRYAYFNNGTLISTTVRLFQQWYAYFNNGTLISTTVRLSKMN